MPRNESKNEIIEAYENTIQPQLDTLEYGRQNSICWNFRNQISICPDLGKNLQPILAHIKPYRLSTTQRLYVNHYETPCLVFRNPRTGQSE